ncbi:hypothetical protein [Acidiphilium acidophilum]|uniref:hypothetical protein n=1 Tax=Acidiphilium acidophilum TaxID=76588 RepID=UPI002E8E6D03|nr:hypothetical protein [Acidiphilium acidophilum]
MPISAVDLSGELALALVSGTLLNLTLCVLPIIPLKIGNFTAGVSNSANLIRAIRQAGATSVFTE